MEVIAALLYAAAVLALAEVCAWIDAERITGHKPIKHFRSWIVRAAIVGSLAGLLWHFQGLPLLPLLGFGAFAFSAWFRLRLNKRRGKDCRYVSASNQYDRAFLFVSHVLPGAHESDEWVHRAGTIAYLTEITISAACVLWVALTL
jgi:hypothetical protein